MSIKMRKLGTASKIEPAKPSSVAVASFREAMNAQVGGPVSASPAFKVEPIGEDAVLAGAVSAAVAKVPVQTLVGNITNTTVNPNFFGINRLTDGSVAGSWTSAARRMLPGDATLAEMALSRQLQHGTYLNQAVLDEDRAMTVMGLDWREIQLLTEEIKWVVLLF